MFDRDEFEKQMADDARLFRKFFYFMMIWIAFCSLMFIGVVYWVVSWLTSK